jgi:glucosamine--fructose-6-phosphate aminotransferase (isomerizing)
MCGIIGYIGKREPSALIYNGLKRLEYRGYDSSGIAILDGKRIAVERAVGKLSNMDAKMASLRAPYSAEALQTGIGHTRWATHGGVTDYNAHPHQNASGSIAVIQNGIIENFAELKHELQTEGVQFKSETDTEVVPHLVDALMRSGLNFEQAAFKTLGQLQGSNAIVMMSVDEPGKLIAARLGNAGGVSIGVNSSETFIASDVPGIVEHTRNIIFLEDGDVAIVAVGKVEVRRLDGSPVAKKVHSIAWDPVSAEKGEYRHFMQKEIYEQARAVTDTLRGRVNFETGDVTLDGFGDWRPNKIHSVACGTSRNSALVGKHYLENIAKIPVEVDYGSEFRYRDPLVIPGEALLGITQSGETADTLAAMHEGRLKGAKLWAIVNAIGSEAERIADATIGMRTGPEIGVCSTKTFIASMVDQYLLACHLAQRSGDAALVARSRAAARELTHLPGLVSRTLENTPIYDELANKFHDRKHALFLGRGMNYPIALEGALKLKEVSYIHAEGYPAGEMKHGPIALIDETMPVICIAVRDAVYEKMLSQVEQVRARGGIVIAVATEGDEFIKTKADHVLFVPKAAEDLYPILATIPLQRLSYHMALRLGCDVDQPRNLAKSVTVE